MENRRKVILLPTTENGPDPSALVDLLFVLVSDAPAALAALLSAFSASKTSTVHRAPCNRVSHLLVQEDPQQEDPKQYHAALTGRFRDVSACGGLLTYIDVQVEEAQLRAEQERNKRET